MSQELEPSRIVIVSGPVGFDPGNALFAEGVHVGDDDLLVAIERPGNVSIEVIED